LTSVRPVVDEGTSAPPVIRRHDGFLLPKQLRRVLAGAALLGGGSYAVSVLVRQGASSDAVWDTVIGPAAALLGIAPMLRRRSALGFGVSTAAAAFVVALLLSSLIVVPETSHPLGEESVAGALSWLAPYPLIALHLVLLARARLRRVPGTLWLDAALFAGAAGAGLGATLLDPVMRAAGSALGPSCSPPTSPCSASPSASSPPRAGVGTHSCGWSRSEPPAWRAATSVRSSAST
jgi:hypothetical protein